MKTSNIRGLVDLLMYGMFCFLMGTGLLLQYRLVSGSRGGHGLTLMGFSRHEWGHVHLWVGFVLILLLIVHLVLNYGFIKRVVAREKTWIALLIGLIGLGVTAVFLLLPLERGNAADAHTPGYGAGGQGRGMRQHASQAEHP